MQAVAQQTIACYPPLSAPPGIQPKLHQMSAFVFSFEDVLAPMSFLVQRVGLQPTRSCLEAAKAAYAQDRYLQQALASVEEEAIELLRTAAAMGPVFVVTTVVTEKSSRYMETTCAAFFPRLAQWLSSANTQQIRGPVRVLTAPHKFANVMESSAWLVRVYQQIVKVAVCDAQGDSTLTAASLNVAHQLLQRRESGTLSLVSVSASPTNQAASIRAFDVAPFLVPKGVHVPGGDPTSALNLEHFFAQLRTLQGYVGVAAAHSSAFSTSL
ncbi:hypothetical protein PF005_g22737 [Phytophthora fragariae]|uniref:Uncharacterized protein n=1 Tax=Phytophthora fragariae TaxID=53985 RepID=A0A6A3WAE4_9STRA|nr:hypothetical protein PF003_g28452 [Phytophthora fragariae]KAE8926261.1 hypothetical protein PF009_g23549 [Phytophthora fragariae]KAE8982954.1 hypothetical protein PF011_g21397 [Phytophthora fragariae]KAE9081078.1 hypothetical protein PF010_g22131 [Phytophthora fragariae]KAE9081610.1 hypothetical protein PF007_g22594 [Phytophthora fragariae]